MLDLASSLPPPPPPREPRPHLQPIYLSVQANRRLRALASSRGEPPGRTAALIVEQAMEGVVDPPSGEAA